MGQTTDRSIKIHRLFNKGLTLKEVNRILLKELTPLTREYESVRHSISRIYRNNYRNKFEEKLGENKFSPEDNWNHGWLKTKDASVFIKNNKGEKELEETIENCFKKYLKFKVKKFPKVETKTTTFDRLVISDIHIGLDPNKSGNSMYPMKWGLNEIDSALKEIISHVLKNKRSDVIYIDNLGDYLDGYEAQTTRGGHKLEQNMSTSEQFEKGIEFMITLIEILIKEYKQIYVRNITNDNHGGNFGLICGIAIEKIISLKYSNVKFYNQRKFIEHYQVGNHVYLLCHGKDKHIMKYGFSAIPSKDNIHKIENYIATNKLNKENVILEFSKGDSHLYNADNGSSDIFRYVSYPTLAPGSEWVTTNFKKGKRGFVFMNVDYKNDLQNIHPKYL